MVFLSLSAFFITLRETMEAALVVGLLLAYLTKTKNNHLKKDIWIGSGLAVIASIIGAILFQKMFGGFTGDVEKLFEGIVMITAAIVLTWMIFFMFTNSKKVKYEIEEKVNLVVSQEKKYALTTLAFISVFREGIETVLFLASIEVTEEQGSVFTGSLLGIGTAIIIAILLFRGSIELNLKQFFNVTSVILIFFAAGLFSHGIHEFQELAWFGPETTLWNKQLWDWSSILNDKTGTIGPLLRALFGYQDKPSLLELLAYGLYWISITLAFKKITKIDTQTIPVSA